MTTHSSAIQREMRVRTSLQRAPSGVTTNEIAARRAELEPILDRRHGVLIIKEDDPDLTGMERLMVQGLRARRRKAWEAMA